MMQDKRREKKPDCNIDRQAPQLDATFFSARDFKLIPSNSFHSGPHYGRLAQELDGSLVEHIRRIISVGTKRSRCLDNCPHMLELGAFVPYLPGAARGPGERTDMAEPLGMSSPSRPFLRSLLRTFGWLIVAVVVIAFCLLRWGGGLLIASDPARATWDAAIVLQGSIVAEKVRIAGAINLLRQNVADEFCLAFRKNLTGDNRFRPLRVPISSEPTATSWPRGSTSANSAGAWTPRLRKHRLSALHRRASLALDRDRDPRTTIRAGQESSGEG